MGNMVAFVERTSLPYITTPHEAFLMLLKLYCGQWFPLDILLFCVNDYLLLLSILYRMPRIPARLVFM